MALETTELNQKAVLWAASGSFDNFGKHKVDAKIEIDVRWMEKRQEAVDAQGNTIAVDATVVVDQEIAVGSIMWKGILDDVATPPVDLKEVVVYNEIPDLKGREFRRTVLLQRYSNELPELA